MHENIQTGSMYKHCTEISNLEMSHYCRELLKHNQQGKQYGFNMVFNMGICDLFSYKLAVSHKVTMM